MNPPQLAHVGYEMVLRDHLIQLVTFWIFETVGRP